MQCSSSSTDLLEGVLCVVSDTQTGNSWSHRSWLSPSLVTAAPRENRSRLEAPAIPVNPSDHLCMSDWLPWQMVG